MISADNYIGLFEENIILSGIEEGILKTNEVMVPVKNGKLDNSNFGKFLGNRFIYNRVMVIDYYGLLKKSGAFIDKYKSYTEVEVKRLKSGIIHFASIKIEDITNLDKSLAVDFPAFKNYLVHLRGFSPSKITQELKEIWVK